MSTKADQIQAWHNRNPAARHAHRRVYVEVRAGRLKPEPCAFCGEVDRNHAHHEDYSKPLEVIWLCPTCHALLRRIGGFLHNFFQHLAEIYQLAPEQVALVGKSRSFPQRKSTPQLAMALPLLARINNVDSLLLLWLRTNKTTAVEQKIETLREAARGLA